MVAAFRTLRWLVLIVPACAYVPLEQSPYQDFGNTFIEAQATRTQIVEDLGPPNHEDQDYRFMLYEWESDGLVVAHPAVSVFACSSPVQSFPGINRDTLVMEFDPDGVLIDSELVRNTKLERAELIRRFERSEPLAAEPPPGEDNKK